MKPYALILAALLTACSASRGTYFEWQDVNKIRNGWTREQVTELLGEPNSITGDGSSMTWSYAHYNMVTTFQYSRAIRVDFDQQGRVINVQPEGLAAYLAKHGD